MTTTKYTSIDDLKAAEIEFFTTALRRDKEALRIIEERIRYAKARLKGLSQQKA